MPQTQLYTRNGFGTNSNPMIAVTENKTDTYLSFKNVCGYLRLYLYGDSINVKSIRLEGNQNEKMSGKANITMPYSEDPVINMFDDAHSSITLYCGDGIELGAASEDATEFWFVVPPVHFENGFTIIVEDDKGNKYTKSTENKIEIKRNVISSMAASKIENRLEYQLFEKESDGIDGVITQSGAYALLKETPNNDAIVLISGMFDEEEKDYMLIDGNGFIKAMSLEDNEFVSFFYTPDCVWVMGENEVIAEIPYSEFPSFEIETQTRATILTRNPIYQALSIRKKVKDILKKPIKEVTKMILENFIEGKYGRYGETANGFIDAVFNITDILNLLELLDKLQEIQFFDNASLVTLPANVEDVVNVSLPCEIKNLSDNTLYHYAKQKYGDVVNYTYTLNMNVYENSSLISSIIDTQSKTISGNGVETFDFKADKLNHSYGYEPSLKVDVTIEIDLEAACRAAIQDLPPGYQIPVGETRVDRKSCIIYGDKESFVTSYVGSIIYDVLNVTDKSADINCSFSKTPSGAICGIEYSSDKCGVQRQTTSNTAGERIVTLSSLHPDTKYTCKAYVQYAGETYYSETSESFTTEPKDNQGCPDENHPHWIDLGLPSGTLWSCCNVGASAPEEFGEYFTYDQITSAPSKEQIEELIKYTLHNFTYLNGVFGSIFKGLNGAEIFLPAAGWYHSAHEVKRASWIPLQQDPEWYDRVGTAGFYWSSTKIENEQDLVKYRYVLYFEQGYNWNCASSAVGCADIWTGFHYSIHKSLRQVR